MNTPWTTSIRVPDSDAGFRRVPDIRPQDGWDTKNEDAGNTLSVKQAWTFLSLPWNWHPFWEPFRKDTLQPRGAKHHVIHRESGTGMTSCQTGSGSMMKVLLLRGSRHCRPAVPLEVDDTRKGANIGAHTWGDMHTFSSTIHPGVRTLVLVPGCFRARFDT